jgi:L-threonylcarbamoyladenylate synthase
MAKIISNVESAAELLHHSVIGIPTETVYGLAANAFNPELVARIFEIKNRPTFDPLIVHCWSIEQVQQFTSSFPPQLKRLADAFWPGPLTLLLPRNELIPDLVTSGLPDVAVRIPNHPLTLQLLKSLPFPLAAPSANPFGYISPTSAQHVNDQLGDKIAHILDGSVCSIGLESTIVGILDKQVTIFRLGGLAPEDIELIVGKVQVQTNQSSNPRAPGMLESHYAPRKKLLLGSAENLLHENRDERPFLILFDTYSTKYPKSNQLLLSPTGSIKEAAINLFAALRQADKSEMEYIIAEEVPNIGLGRAINDRLKRAAG